MDPVIFSYTRRQAIDDGVLVDVSETAREAGIVFPVALTRSVWNQYVQVPEEVVGIQDEPGRLWDIIWMMFVAIRAGKAGDVLRFHLHVKNRRTAAPELVELKAICGPGDEGEPVITVMLPEED